MASKTYKQEMPPSGGYGSIEWAKRPTPRRISGYGLFALFAAFTGASWTAFYFIRRQQRKEELEMRDARIAIIPLIMAEQQRMMLKQFRSNREEENELMNNVEGWRTGTLWGEPIYHNLRNRWIMPATEEYFAHVPYWTKFYMIYDTMNH